MSRGSGTQNARPPRSNWFLHRTMLIFIYQHEQSPQISSGLVQQSSAIKEATILAFSSSVASWRLLLIPGRLPTCPLGLHPASLDQYGGAPSPTRAEYAPTNLTAICLDRSCS